VVVHAIHETKRQVQIRSGGQEREPADLCVRDGREAARDSGNRKTRESMADGRRH